MKYSREISAALALTVATGLFGACGENPSVADQAKADYVEKYGCMSDVDIVIGDTGEDAAKRDNTLAVGDPGQITLDSEDWSRMERDEQRNTILHEMTHACKPVDPSALKSASLGDGADINAAHGLAVLVTLPDGMETGFRLIEEGAAEALAYSLDESYEVSSVDYVRLGSLTLELMEKQNISPAELSEYVQHNDLMGYVAALHGEVSATYQQLEDVMAMFQVTQNNTALSGDNLN